MQIIYISADEKVYITIDERENLYSLCVWKMIFQNKL